MTQKNRPLEFYKLESEALNYSKKIYEIEADENMVRYLENKDVLKGKIGELAKLLRERYSGDIKDELVETQINTILEMRLSWSDSIEPSL